MTDATSARPPEDRTTDGPDQDPGEAAIGLDMVLVDSARGPLRRMIPPARTTLSFARALAGKPDVVGKRARYLVRELGRTPIAWHEAGAPSMSQVWLAAGVALSAGVIATILFFQATGMVRNNPVALGAAEAMQAAELLFAATLGALFLHEAWPQGRALLGAVVVTAGIVAFAIVVARPAAGSTRRTKILRGDKGA